ncbi:hypothetical protein H1R20_g13024, partial [Candolleomyces eurysporus]
MSDTTLRANQVAFTLATVAGVLVVLSSIWDKMLDTWSSSRRVSNSRKASREASREASRDASYPGKQHGSHSNKLGCANVGGEETFKLERAERVPHYGVPETQRDRYKRVAEKALQTIEKGSYVYRGKFTPLHIKNSTDRTKFFPEESVLTEWRKKPVGSTQGSIEVSLSILNVTTLDAARILSNSYRFQGYEGAPPQTGVLNFASATKPGGGFINGAEAQEESIARVSTLYASLTTFEGNRFYEAHTRRPGADRDKAYEAHSRPRTGQERSSYYTHGMVYSPGVVVFQNDEGDAVDPYQIEVVSCAAVNAGELRSEGGSMAKGWAASLEVEIEATMEERMGRILYLFEKKGIRNIVLGTFGTGVFKNKVDVIARLWARLLVGRDARFKFSFDRVIFAITGDETFAEFNGAFSAWAQKDTPKAASGTKRTRRTRGPHTS